MQGSASVHAPLQAGGLEYQAYQEQVYFRRGARCEAPVLHGHDAVRVCQGVAQAQLHHLSAACPVQGLGSRVWAFQINAWSPPWCRLLAWLSC